MIDRPPYALVTRVQEGTENQVILLTSLFH